MSKRERVGGEEEKGTEKATERAKERRDRTGKKERRDRRIETAR